MGPVYVSTSLFKLYKNLKPIFLEILGIISLRLKTSRAKSGIRTLNLGMDFHETSLCNYVKHPIFGQLKISVLSFSFFSYYCNYLSCIEIIHLCLYSSIGNHGRRRIYACWCNSSSQSMLKTKTLNLCDLTMPILLDHFVADSSYHLDWQTSSTIGV